MAIYECARCGEYFCNEESCSQFNEPLLRGGRRYCGRECAEDGDGARPRAARTVRCMICGEAGCRECAEFHQPEGSAGWLCTDEKCADEHAEMDSWPPAMDDTG